MECKEWEELETVLGELNERQEQIFQLNQITSFLNDGLVNREVAEFALKADPTLFDVERYPLASFTVEPSEVNADVVQMGWGKLITAAMNNFSNLSLKAAVLLTAAILWLLNRIGKRLFSKSSAASGGSPSTSPGSQYVPPTPSPDKNLTTEQINELIKSDSFVYSVYLCGQNIDWDKAKSEIEFLIKLLENMVSHAEDIPRLIGELYEQCKTETLEGKVIKEGNKIAIIPSKTDWAAVPPRLTTVITNADRTNNGLMVQHIANDTLALLDPKKAQIGKFGEIMTWGEPATNSWLMHQKDWRRGVAVIPKMEGTRMLKFREHVYSGTNDCKLPFWRRSRVAPIPLFPLRTERSNTDKYLSKTWAQGRPLSGNWLGSLKIWDKQSISKLEVQVEALNERLNKLLSSEEHKKMVSRHSFIDHPPVIYEKDRSKGIMAISLMFPAFLDGNRSLPRVGEFGQVAASVNWSLGSTYLTNLQREMSEFTSTVQIPVLREVFKGINHELSADEYLTKQLNDWGVMNPNRQ